jgi:hypothetical protein
MSNGFYNTVIKGTFNKVNESNGTGLKSWILPKINYKQDIVNNVGIKTMQSIRQELEDKTINRKYRVETFEEAIERLQLAENDIKNSYNYHCFLADFSKLFLAIGVGFVAYGLFTFAQQVNFVNFNFIVMSFSMSILSLIMLLKFDFRLTQIERKELFNFKEYLKEDRINKLFKPATYNNSSFFKELTKLNI